MGSSVLALNSVQVALHASLEVGGVGFVGVEVHREADQFEGSNRLRLALQHLPQNASKDWGPLSHQRLVLHGLRCFESHD
jgi:hypothetical protein